jgi:hypothetical protein
LFWEVKGEGLISYNFHLHPLAVYPEKKSYSFYGTIDDDFVEKCCPNFDQSVYIPKSSNDLFLAELTSEERKCDSELRKDSELDLFYWIKRYTSPFHLKLFRNLIYIELNPGISRSDGWKITQDASKKFIERILITLEKNSIRFSFLEHLKIFFTKKRFIYTTIRPIKNIIRKIKN